MSVPSRSEDIGADGVIAFIALGSNMGDRAANLRQAVAHLNETDGVTVLRASPIYETEPVGPVRQEAFLNAVTMVRTTLSPEDLLNVCLGVEAAMGRVRDVRWGPRTIDLDLILFGDRRVDRPGLVVPHPDLATRAFVLVPLADLAPEALLPDGRRVGDLLLALGPAAGVRHVCRVGDLIAG